MILLLVTCMNFLDYVVPSMLVKTGTASNTAALKYWKTKSFCYITVPEHEFEKLYKLHGIEFNGRKLVIEKTKTPLKKTTGKNKQAFLQSQSPATDFEMETFESFPPIQKIGARRAFSFLWGTKNIFFF